MCLMKKYVMRVIGALSMLSVDKNTKRFINHNIKIWKDFKPNNPDSVILAEFHNITPILIAVSYFSNIISRKHNAEIKTFSPKKLYHHRAKRKIYNSFNTAGHVTTHLNKEQKVRKDDILKTILPGIKSKQDVFDLTVMGVWIGIDIYESYLRELLEPTIRLNDKRIDDFIERGVGLLIFWLDYFSKNNVAAIIVSHDQYLDLNVLCKVAYTNKVPVYLPNCIGATYATEPFSVHSNYSTYKNRFNSLTLDKQAKARAISKEQLDKRLNGEVGVNMAYSTESAFLPYNPKNRVLRKSNNIKILISSHCFYDNPHGYGGLLFLDFYDWLCFIGDISEKTNHDWYLKVHPDPLPGTLDNIQEILQKFPKITVIPHLTSHLQLANEGIDFVLTCFGTVGIEYPVLGKQVINAGFNPRSSFSFNWNPISIEEYEKYLLNLDTLNIDIDINEVYAGYYMQYYYEQVDDFIFTSYENFLLDLTDDQRSKSEPFKYFIDQFDNVRHQKIISIFQEFIDSEKRHLFSRGPEDD